MSSKNPSQIIHNPNDRYSSLAGMFVGNKFFSLTHNLWVKIQLKTPSFVRRVIIPRLHEAKEIVRLLSKPYLPIYQLQGQGAGGPLTVTYMGLGYAKPFLKDLIFVESPIEKKVGQIPFWRHNELTNLSSGDIIIVEAARYLIRKLPRQNAVVLPPYIHHIMDVRGDWQDVRSRFHETVRKNELRWIRKYNYDYEISHNSQDFEEFYTQMYLPTMRGRHGELSSPMSLDEGYQYFRQGYLFRVKQDGAWVSGIVCDPQERILIARILGVKNGDIQLIHQGATSATYYAAIHWANQNGYEGVNFLGTEPFLNMGLFQQKRKWGMRVNNAPNLHRQLWLRIRTNTPSISEFLRENPFVIEQDGKLHGLILVDDLNQITAEIKQKWEKRYITPGLNSLIIRPVNSFAPESNNRQNPSLIIPISPPSFKNN